MGSSVGMLVRALMCPDCGQIKDRRDPDRYGGEGSAGVVRDRWCHNYRAHERHGGGPGKRRMTRVVFRIEREGED
jgi:hypothetical protein